MRLLFDKHHATKLFNHYFRIYFGRDFLCRSKYTSMYANQLLKKIFILGAPIFYVFYETVNPINQFI